MPMHDPQAAADAYQDAILPTVSRTFALTIPQLPASLRRAVTNAYLLCRVADTIEDEPQFCAQQKHDFENAFLEVVMGSRDAQAFAAQLAPLFSSRTSAAERELVAQLPRVLEVTQSLDAVQRQAIFKCLAVMCHGMHDFQRTVGRQGLGSVGELDRYCYCVAGVVGEMLTELLLDHDPQLLARRDELMALAVSFGQGLQMTNILKDQWEDHAQGVCWLPQDIFGRYQVQLQALQPGARPGGYGGAMAELIGLAHAHLRRALAYALLIPRRHVGFRRFCLWSIGMALLTLRKLHGNLGFCRGAEVKISRGAVAGTLGLTRLSGHSNAGLGWLFTLAARGLPLTPLAGEWNAAPWPGHGHGRVAQ